MWGTEDRRKYFKINCIDPYEVLGIVKGQTSLKEAKKRYHLLAKECHPDKNNRTDSLDFKLLKECYYFVKEEEEIIETPQLRQTNLNGLKEDRLRDTLNFSNNIDTDRSLYSTNFEDNKIREQLFAVNEIDFNEIDEIMKEKETAPTEYTRCLDYRPNNLFKDKKKFNVKYFNEVFEASKEINKEVVKFDINTLGGRDSRLSGTLGEISYYNDIIIEKKKDLSDDVADWRTIYKGPSMDNFSDKEIKKLVAQRRKQQKNKEPEQDTLTLLAKKKSEEMPQVNAKVSFTEASINFRDSQMVSSRAELKKNKEYIKTKLSVYPEKYRKILQ